MTFYTRGPWRAQLTGNPKKPITIIRPAMLTEIATIKGEGAYSGVKDAGERLANARLIAAAPQLLDVAKAAYGALSGLQSKDTLLCLRLMDAILEAEGRDE